MAASPPAPGKEQGGDAAGAGDGGGGGASTSPCEDADGGGDDAGGGSKDDKEEEEEAEDPSECIPLQLQRLFGQLQLSDKTCVETRALTDSFGWTAQVKPLGRWGACVVCSRLCTCKGSGPACM